MSSRVLYHGPELDAAIEGVPHPEAMGVCPTALSSRQQAHIDRQVEECLSESAIADTLALLQEQGLTDGLSDADADAAARVVAIRSAIGGTFSFALGIGLELARGGVDLSRYSR
jgi:hypothetical protein